jgi:hypothetical protein
MMRLSQITAIEKMIGISRLRQNEKMMIDLELAQREV